jgi:hypothetical protein
MTDFLTELINNVYTNCRATDEYKTHIDNMIRIIDQTLNNHFKEIYLLRIGSYATNTQLMTPYSDMTNVMKMNIDLCLVFRGDYGNEAIDVRKGEPLKKIIMSVLENDETINKMFKFVNPVLSKNHIEMICTSSALSTLSTLSTLKDSKCLSHLKNTKFLIKICKEVNDRIFVASTGGNFQSNGRWIQDNKHRQINYYIKRISDFNDTDDDKNDIKKIIMFMKYLTQMYSNEISQYLTSTIIVEIVIRNYQTINTNNINNTNNTNNINNTNNTNNTNNMNNTNNTNNINNTNNRSGDIGKKFRDLLSRFRNRIDNNFSLFISYNDGVRENLFDNRYRKFLAQDFLEHFDKFMHDIDQMIKYESFRNCKYFDFMSDFMFDDLKSLAPPEFHINDDSNNYLDNVMIIHYLYFHDFWSKYQEWLEDVITKSYIDGIKIFLNDWIEIDYDYAIKKLNVNMIDFIKN